MNDVAVKLWRMSSGFGPLSRSRLLGSERPVSACTVNCVGSGVLSMPLPASLRVEGETLREALGHLQRHRLVGRLTPIDCTWLM